MITVQQCDKCGGKLQISVGQVVRSNQLLWHRSCRCEKCGLATEEDGKGLDKDIRKEILCGEGGESILVVDSMESRTKALLESKQVFGFESKEVLRLRQIEEGCVASGTRVEMEWLMQRLAAKGIKTHLRPVG